MEKRLPSKYYSKLTKKDKTKQLKELKKSRDLYKRYLLHTKENAFICYIDITTCQKIRK